VVEGAQDGVRAGPHPGLRVTRDRQNRDLALLGAVTPEHTIGGWSRLFGIGFEHLLSAGPG